MANLFYVNKSLNKEADTNFKDNKTKTVSKTKKNNEKTKKLIKEKLGEKFKLIEENGDFIITRENNSKHGEVDRLYKKEGDSFEERLGGYIWYKNSIKFNKYGWECANPSTEIKFQYDKEGMNELFKGDLIEENGDFIITRKHSDKYGEVVDKLYKKEGDSFEERLGGHVRYKNSIKFNEYGWECANPSTEIKFQYDKEGMNELFKGDLIEENGDFIITRENNSKHGEVDRLYKKEGDSFEERLGGYVWYKNSIKFNKYGWEGLNFEDIKMQYDKEGKEKLSSKDVTKEEKKEIEKQKTLDNVESIGLDKHIEQIVYSHLFPFGQKDFIDKLYKYKINLFYESININIKQKNKKLDLFDLYDKFNKNYRQLEGIQNNINIIQKALLNIDTKKDEYISILQDELTEQRKKMDKIEKDLKKTNDYKNINDQIKSLQNMLNMGVLEEDDKGKYENKIEKLNKELKDKEEEYLKQNKYYDLQKEYNNLNNKIDKNKEKINKYIDTNIKNITGYSLNTIKEILNTRNTFKSDIRNRFDTNFWNIQTKNEIDNNPEKEKKININNIFKIGFFDSDFKKINFYYNDDGNYVNILSYEEYRDIEFNFEIPLKESSRDREYHEYILGHWSSYGRNSSEEYETDTSILKEPIEARGTFQENDDKLQYYILKQIFEQIKDSIDEKFDKNNFKETIIQFFEKYKEMEENDDFKYVQELEKTLREKFVEYYKTILSYKIEQGEIEEIKQDLINEFNEKLDSVL